MTNLSRRSFLGAIIAAAAAPAIVRSGIIMPIKPKLVVPDKVILDQAYLRYSIGQNNWRYMGYSIINTENNIIER